MNMTGRFFWVLLTGLLVSLPAVIYSDYERYANTALWYAVVSALVGAMAVGLIGAFIGSLIIFKNRNRINKGIKSAVITTALISALLSYFLIYPLIRS